MQYVEIYIHTPVGRHTPTDTPSRYRHVYDTTTIRVRRDCRSLRFVTTSSCECVTSLLVFTEKCVHKQHNYT